MSERYPGGYITKSPPTPTVSAAPGVWTLDQAMQYIKAGQWPLSSHGYLMIQGLGANGALDRSLNANLTPSAATVINETIYYGPWNAGSVQNNNGGNPTMMVKDDGTLWGVGRNDNGQIGINQVDGTPDLAWVVIPYQVGQSTDWLNAKISSNTNAVAAIKSNGTLWTWGAAGSGRLGLNDTANRSSPTQVGALTDWAKISRGAAHCLAIKTDGTLWAWGAGSNGELGNSDRNNKSSPVQIGALTTWSEIAAGNDYSLGVLTDGTMWAWGRNGDGRLGINVVQTAFRSSPIQIGSLTTWSKVFAGTNLSFAISTTGALWAWGLNTEGQLGQNNRTSRSSPVQVGSLTDWSVIFPYDNAVRAIKTDKTLWGWGQTGIEFSPSANNLSSPVQIGSDTDWDSFVGGFNSNYWDGKSNNTNPSFLIFKTGKTRPYGSSRVNATFPYFTPAPGATWPVLLNTDKWQSVSAAGFYSYTSAGVKNNGTLWTWGQNTNGMLGQNDVANRSSPVQVGALTTWKNVYVGEYFSTYAINQSNELYSWGRNDYGQLGQNNATDRSSPVQVGALTNWKQVAAGFGSVSGAAVAVKTDNTLWAWGDNTYGNLGTNNRTNRSSPVQVGALTNWGYVSTGGGAVLAVKTDGTLWGWGRNQDRQLGDGGTTDRSSPVQIGALTNWKKVAVGRNHTIAVKTDGTVWAWGNNARGQVGDQTTTNRASPVQIGSATNWVDVGAGYDISYAITTSGTLYVWGWISVANPGSTGNQSPLTGYTELVYKSSPVQVGAKSYYKEVIANGNNTNAAFLTNAT